VNSCSWSMDGLYLAVAVVFEKEEDKEEEDDFEPIGEVQVWSVVSGKCEARLLHDSVWTNLHLQQQRLSDSI